MNTQELEMLQSILDNTDMGMHAVDTLLQNKKINNSPLVRTLQEQRDDFSLVHEQAKHHISKAGHPVKEKGALLKAMSTIGIQWNTLVDSSVSHVAEMMIQGSTMGITDITRELNQNQAQVQEPTKKLADRLLHIHQKNIDCMRNYL